jgi:hypothetical protein
VIGRKRGVVLSILLIAAMPGSVAAERPGMSLDDYLARKKQLSAVFLAARTRCQSLSSREICLAEATGADSVAKADLEVAYRSTPRSRFEASEARARARFGVARERCTDATPPTREACLREASAQLDAAVAAAARRMKAAEAARER